MGTTATRARTARNGAFPPPVVPLHRQVGAILETQALCHDVIASTQRIYNAAMVGSRAAVLTEAGRLSQRAVKARDELRRLAREVEQ